jgi:hypothetical protein
MKWKKKTALARAVFFFCNGAGMRRVCFLVAGSSLGKKMKNRHTFFQKVLDLSSKVVYNSAI